MTDSMTWTSVKLGDVAFDINERVANPSQSGYNRFVGLDHLTSGDLTVRDWGSTEDVNSSMKLFKRGDVLFGRRNTYLKRASMAEFDGVCSGDAYVLRTNPDYLINNYLPLILNSSDLWDYTNSYSAGGMSKRAKWRDLANYEFYLPPKEEQERIAKILWAAEDVIVRNETFLAEAEHYKQLMMRDLFSKGIGHSEFKEDKKVGLVPKDWKVGNIEDLVDPLNKNSIKTGPFGSTLKKSTYCKKGYKIYGQEHVIAGNLKIGDYYIDEKKFNELIGFKIEKGDLLLSLVGTIGKILVVPENFEKGLINPRLIKITLNPTLGDSIFLSYILRSNFILYQIQKLSHGQTMPILNGGTIKKLRFGIPPLPEQKQIAAILTQIDETIAAARETIESTKALKMKLIDELLSPSEGYV
jgi:type I restriction enzyme, S subunit